MPNMSLSPASREIATGVGYAELSRLGRKILVLLIRLHFCSCSPLATRRGFGVLRSIFSGTAAYLVSARSMLGEYPQRIWRV